tara:strand:+ start:469 stop:714 length:246 start_codon:yes stop_codon:yes gene_type:complete
MKKITKKSVKIQQFLTFFVLCLFFTVNSCTFSYKTGEFSTKTKRIDCKWSPDYEKIGESAMDSMDDMKRIEIQQMKAACNF